MILTSFDFLKLGAMYCLPDNEKSKKNEDCRLQTGRDEDEAKTNTDQDVRPI